MTRPPATGFSSGADVAPPPVCWPGPHTVPTSARVAMTASVVRQCLIGPPTSRPPRARQSRRAPLAPPHSTDTASGFRKFSSAGLSAGEVARGPVPRLVLDELWVDLRADLLRLPAPRMESTAARWVDR